MAVYDEESVLNGGDPYHVFYVCNPANVSNPGNTAAWCHASSPDLVR